MKKPLFLTVKISFVETLESWLTGLGIGFLVLGIIGVFFFFKETENTFYQGVYVDNISLAGLTKQQAAELLSSKKETSNTIVTISVDDIKISSTSSQLEILKNYQESLSSAFEVGRSGFPLTRLTTILSLSVNPQHFSSTYSVNEKKTAQVLAALAKRVDVLGENPSANLELSGVASSLVINKGSIGREINQTKTNQILINQITTSTNLGGDLLLEAIVASTAAELSLEEIETARERAQNFIGMKAIFTADEVSTTLNDQSLISLLAFPQGITPDLSEILEAWEVKITRDPQEPTFVFDPETLVVESFTPPKNGLTLNQEKTATQIKQALEEIETTSISYKNQSTEESPQEQKDTFEFELPVATKAPKKSLANTNQLGINERVGFGDSEYDHSIPTRIHNVSLASDLITNKIIAPGEEYSFNKELGEVSRRTGFQPAYVISGGKTILGDGGGVCQVSTTLFRAVLNAGLEVTKRKQHSYRVSYYELNEKPGIDATVYSGEVDLRFRNDTDHHILVHSQADPENLYMSIELYGTSDGRQTEIIDHEVWDFRAPPPPVYSDDSSLPHGVVRQVDWAVSGVKAKFTNLIKDKEGNVIREDEYYSNYVPWSAKYIRGV